MPWEKHVTLSDIARRVDLSVGAVSLAMRNHPSIPAKTARRVKRMAAIMKYQPDPAMSALAAYRTGLRIRRDFSVIALVSNWATADEWTRRPSARELHCGGDRARPDDGLLAPAFLGAGQGLMTPAEIQQDPL